MVDPTRWRGSRAHLAKGNASGCLRMSQEERKKSSKEDMWVILLSGYHR